MSGLVEMRGQVQQSFLLEIIVLNGNSIHKYFYKILSKNAKRKYCRNNFCSKPVLVKQLPIYPAALSTDNL